MVKMKHNIFPRIIINQKTINDVLDVNLTPKQEARRVVTLCPLSAIEIQRIKHQKWYIYANSGLNPITIYYPDGSYGFCTQQYKQS